MAAIFDDPTNVSDRIRVTWGMILEWLELEFVDDKLICITNIRNLLKGDAVMRDNHPLASEWNMFPEHIKKFIRYKLAHTKPAAPDPMLGTHRRTAYGNDNTLHGHMDDIRTIKTKVNPDVIRIGEAFTCEGSVKCEELKNCIDEKQNLEQARDNCEKIIADMDEEDKHITSTYPEQKPTNYYLIKCHIIELNTEIDKLEKRIA